MSNSHLGLCNLVLDIVNCLSLETTFLIGFYLSASTFIGGPWQHSELPTLLLRNPWYAVKTFAAYDGFP